MAFSQLIRTFALDSWVSAALGLHFSFDGIAPLPNTPRLVFGICKANPLGADADTGYGDGSATDHFVGVRTNASAWTRTSSDTPYYLAGDFEFLTKHGNTVAAQNWASPQTTYLSSDPLVRNALILRMTRAGLNVAASLYAPHTPTGARTDITPAVFAGMVDNGDEVDGYAVTDQKTFTLAFSSFLPNALNVYWNKSQTLLEVSETRVAASLI